MKPKISTEYVDRETGEKLTAKHVQKKYIKIKCKKTIKQLGWNIEIQYIWECELNNQLTLTL